MCENDNVGAVNATEVCREISGELKEITSWFADGKLTPEQLRSAVTTLEAKKVQRFGFVLESAISRTGTVHFSLRFANNRDLCASVDVDPVTGELLIQHAC
jgi:hypothetical protein